MSRPGSPFKQSFEQSILIKMPPKTPENDDPELGECGSPMPDDTMNGSNDESTNPNRPLVSPTNSGRPTSAARRRKQQRGTRLINGSNKLVGATKVSKGEKQDPPMCPCKFSFKSKILVRILFVNSVIL